MRCADIEVPNLTVDMNSWVRSACYPRRTFYPLSDGTSTRYRRITKSCFRTCSTCKSRSQAPFCLYTRRMITNHAEGTFESLRYILGIMFSCQLVCFFCRSEFCSALIHEHKEKLFQEIVRMISRKCKSEVHLSVCERLLRGRSNFANILSTAAHLF